MAQIIPIPLVSSQAQSAHPFLIGSDSQTKRSKNIWVDERGRIRRRTSLMRPYDHNGPNLIVGMYNYEYKSRGARATDLLLGFYSTGDTRDYSSFAGVSVLSDRPYDPRRMTLTNIPTGTSRIRFFDIQTVHTHNRYLHRESVIIYNNSTTSSDGTDLGDMEVWVDNTDATGGGSLIVRNIDFTRIVLATLNNFRVEGQTSGTNIRFGSYVEAKAQQNIWEAPGWTESSGINTIWTPNTVPVMHQYGSFLAIVDDSYVHPLRIWTGSSGKARAARSAPRASVVTSHQGRLIIGGLIDRASQIVASRIFDPFDWNTQNLDFDGAISIPIEEDDKSEVTGLFGDYFGELIVWKRNSVHKISGQLLNDVESLAFPYVRQGISPTIGCASHRTIRQVGNDIVWMSSRGIHSLQTTDKFGDVEESYLSFPISDIFEGLNRAYANTAQAAYEPGLGLYLIGIPTNGSRYLNTLLAYAVVNQRWMRWDIGEFSSLAEGPGISGNSKSIYVSMTGGAGSTTRDHLAVLSFRDSQDTSLAIADSFGGDILAVVDPIDCTLEPGEIFSARTEPAIRYPRKSASRAQFYIAPSGDFTSTVKYSWDGGADQEKSLSMNPAGDPVIGSGFRLGGSSVQGSVVGSQDETVVSSVPMDGVGHTLVMRIEDSNFGHLPYIYLDLLSEIHSPHYTATAKDK